MSAHAVICQVLPASAQRAFDVIHNYPHRLAWDTLLREAYTVGGVDPGKGVESVCTARRSLGGLSFRTRYVTFRPPLLAAVVLQKPTFVFATWAASIRHRQIDEHSSDVTYTLTFTCRPKLLSKPIEKVALLAFRLETARRLRALSEYLKQTARADPDSRSEVRPNG